MDISKNTRVDLLYLTNPNLKIKYNKKFSKLFEIEDLRFYRKRILQETKDMLRGERINEKIDNAFENYASQLIQHYKFIDKKNVIQEEYKNLPKSKSKNIKTLNLANENKLIINKPQPIKKTIKDFIPIVVKERKPKKIVIPKQKKYDLKNPKNREKEKSNQFITNATKNKKKKPKKEKK